MTRIIAGEFGGRRLRVPEEGTRPTSDRVREAILNIVEARMDLENARVLDLYAGSGAVGLEAISRGAASATLVDASRRATAAIAANVRTCGAGARATVVTRSVGAYLSGEPYEPFDLVFLDPPYDLDNEQMTSDLAALAAGRLVVDGMVVVERATRAAPTEWPAGLTVVVSKNYGDTRVEVARPE